MGCPVRLLTCNIHHGQGIDGKVKLQRLASVLQQYNPDAVALQEVDRHLPRSHLRHQARVLARYLSMYFAFAPTINWLGICQYGMAVLSRYPISKHQYHPLPAGTEPRGLQVTRISLREEGFLLLNTHLGLDYREREIQIKEIRKILRLLNGPVVLAGDMNTEKLAIPELPVTPVPTLPTFPSYRPRFALDRIFASCHWQVVHAMTLPTTASDHLPLLVELVLES